MDYLPIKLMNGIYFSKIKLFNIILIYLAKQKINRLAFRLFSFLFYCLNKTNYLLFCRLDHK